ncbi:hypothetical protein JKP88DRAFT_260973 [Tribonema minus]|uniref:Uncharacterized protein n=1 Tax=Tribonema minus TaxID=303371 RepID=A0A835Z3C5_9STRA|nr:hypothetical protein JKP88DRAFT_260973 [Tribonema minus]
MPRRLYPAAPVAAPFGGGGKDVLIGAPTGGSATAVRQDTGEDNECDLGAAREPELSGASTVAEGAWTQVESWTQPDTDIRKPTCNGHGHDAAPRELILMLLGTLLAIVAYGASTLVLRPDGGNAAAAAGQQLFPETCSQQQAQYAPRALNAWGLPRGTSGGGWESGGRSGADADGDHDDMEPGASEAPSASARAFIRPLHRPLSKARADGGGAAASAAQGDGGAAAAAGGGGGEGSLEGLAVDPAEMDYLEWSNRCDGSPPRQRVVRCDVYGRCATVLETRYRGPDATYEPCPEPLLPRVTAALASAASALRRHVPQGDADWESELFQDPLKTLDKGLESRLPFCLSGRCGTAADGGEQPADASPPAAAAAAEPANAPPAAADDEEPLDSLIDHAAGWMAGESELARAAISNAVATTAAAAAADDDAPIDDTLDGESLLRDVRSAIADGYEEPEQPSAGGACLGGGGGSGGCVFATIVSAVVAALAGAAAMRWHAEAERAARAALARAQSAARACVECVSAQGARAAGGAAGAARGVRAAAGRGGARAAAALRSGRAHVAAAAAEYCGGWWASRPMCAALALELKGVGAILWRNLTVTRGGGGQRCCCCATAADCGDDDDAAAASSDSEAEDDGVVVALSTK